MNDFLRAWAEEARTWYIVALLAILWTCVIVLVAHGVAWLAAVLGPAAAFTILLVTIVLMIAGGSACVTYRRVRSVTAPVPPEPE